MLALYAHIPFCRHRCSYCDFNTYTSLGDLQSAYADALAQEIVQVAGEERRQANTIFFGGGTPSLMSVADFAKILSALRQGFALSTDAEITLEANPNTVSREYLCQLRELGFNRISFGVQSTIPSELTLLDRQHDFDTVIQAVTWAQEAGFDNFNIDLIYGVPHQTLKSWEASLEAVLALQPPHFSLYCLTIESGTPMQRWLHNGTMPAPDPDLAADQYQLACERLVGYDHYEISNWALPNRECRHNLAYWRNTEYLGLGAGAHGHAGGYRYHVVKQPRVYIRRIAQGDGSYPLSSAVAGKQWLTQEDQIADTMITQLRLLHEGVDLGAFGRKFQTSPQQIYGDSLSQLIDWQLLKIENNCLLLTKKGWFLSNQVFHRLV